MYWDFAGFSSNSNKISFVVNCDPCVVQVAVLILQADEMKCKASSPASQREQ